MNNPLQEIRRGLRRDPLIQAHVHEDSDGEVKVYDMVGKRKLTAPYIVLQQLPVGDLIAVYGDSEVLEAINIQVSCWGNSIRTAWALADAADEAMKNLDLDVTPYEVMNLRRSSNFIPLEDFNSLTYQVVVAYEVSFSR